MKDYTKQELIEVYDSLPRDLQRVIASTETAITIEGIGRKFNLHVDRIGQLANEIGLLMMGLVKPQDFVLRIEKKLLIPSKDAVGITMEINDKILTKIQTMLREIAEKTLPEQDSLSVDLPSAPTVNPKLTSSIFDQKMGGMFTQTKTEGGVKPVDPYREPVN